MAALPVRLDRRGRDPLGAQLSGQVRDLVTRGTLRRGDRLPSTRALAAELGVARSVAEQAYDQLVAEGWLTARRGAGTFVSAEAAPRPAAPARRPSGPGTGLVRLSTGEPWIDPRHRAGWRRAWREVSAATPPRGYDDPCGLPELRAALAERLGRTRGLVVDADEVVVTAGTTAGFRDLLAVLPPGPVGIEDPGYRAAVATTQAAGRTVVDLPAEARHEAAALRGLAAAYVTPAHQHPLGRVMPAADRIALLAASRATGAVVAENDYDSELRYDVAPVPALAALGRDRVAYLGTASKSAPPGLRVGWLVPPPPLLDDVVRHRAVVHDVGAWPTQRALLTLLRDGWLDAVLRTARRVYAERAARVAAVMAPHAEPAATSAGMYSTWLLPQDAALSARDAARQAGFDLPLLSDLCRTAGHTGVVVGFGGVADAELDRALAAIRTGLGG
ncbi:aminotransferase-like domain-containing protein [Krasilnikoviella flava]|uniref:Transcriptional regulator, GntR family n=1 Tax=Krasilnikoviella flava TaxID=526729 RepID=A0A1T5LKP3_9MICO|nr:PLP-dependent aminotransferase family protein [Krasilnikoviella flava]SKC76553.1 transcriptional regulator, GntR family [Krasilnikoviella flava]